MAECRQCGKPIFFASMPSGKKLPCSSPPEKQWRGPDHTVLIVNDRNQAILVTKGSNVRIFAEHWSTCPGANEERKS